MDDPQALCANAHFTLGCLSYFHFVNIKLHPYRLEFLAPFRIAHGVRTHTDAVFVELEMDGVRVFGEATLPPYLPYTQASTMAALSRIDMSQVSGLFTTSELLPSLGIMPSAMEPPAMAALDMALWTLEAKLKNTSVAALLGVTGTDQATRTYTISACEKEEMRDRLAFAVEHGFTTFKLKLNGTDDQRIIRDFRDLTDAAFAVDGNMSWHDWDTLMSRVEELKSLGCLFIEEPFNKEFWQNHEAQYLDYHSVQHQILGIPIIADESCQNNNDIDKLIHRHYSSINIKLQKCGGLHQAMRMLKHPKANDLKFMIGCMSESIVGCSAAEVLSPCCEWNDLDGTFLVKEVPFRN